jgi:hypothetical protein
MKADPKIHSLTASPGFPPRWTRVLDEVVPSFVKDRFSPSEAWKKKPFSKEDVNFFSKGLIELSDFFTVERTGTKLPNYFTTARFRSSYFLYFFGLQGAKFLTLYDRYPRAIDAAIREARKTGVLRVVDVGSGPGTASLAFLVKVLDRLLEEKSNLKKLPFSVSLHWIDHNEAILKDGEALLGRILGLYPDLEGEIEAVLETRPWWKHPRDFDFRASLVLFGNVLNEGSEDPRIFQQGLAPFLRDPGGGGILLLEPAFKSAAQRIAQIRNEILASDSPLPLWGPCLHTGVCPLGEGRDWCHFSVPTRLPGEFFRKFSIKLGGIRDWLKFSFVWIASSDSQKEATPPTGLVRIISDPLRTPRGLENQVCRPERFTYVKTPKKPLYRGEVIHDPLLPSRPPTNRNGKGVRRRMA